MKITHSIGSICIKDKYSIEYRVCKIEYILFEDNSFEYIFTPDYSIIDLLDENTFQGIPGLNLDLRKVKYVRKNIIPTFISERVPNENRENYYELLEEAAIDFMDPLLYLQKTKFQYSGDKLYVKKYEEKETIKIKEVVKKNNVFGVIKLLLDNIAKGNNIEIEDIIIEDNNRKYTFKTLFYLYAKRLESLRELSAPGVEKAKKQNKFKGRKPIEVEKIKFLDMLERVERKEMTAKQASNELGISIDKYYRLKKQINLK